METLLHTGELSEGKEKTSDFKTFVDLIVTTRIRRFTNQCESANEIVGKWALIPERQTDFANVILEALKYSELTRE